MNILLVYSTTEGHTKKISDRAVQHLSKTSCKVDLLNSDNPDAKPDWSAYDAVIIAGSIHQERHQDSLINFVIAHRKELDRLPTALISVSLSAATADGRAAAAGYVERFSWVTKFTPTEVLLLAGALRYSEYDYFKIEVVKHVVMKTTGAFEPTGDHEFTDWKELERFLDGFAAAARK